MNTKTSYSLGGSFPVAAWIAVLAFSAPADSRAQNLLVANGETPVIWAYAPNGSATRFSQFDTLEAMVYDSSGNIFAVDVNENVIYKIAPDGTHSIFLSGGLNGPEGLAFDGSGNLFVTNANIGTISEITPGGAISTFATGMNLPQGLIFDHSGNLYVSVFNPVSGGSILKFAESGGVLSSSPTTFANGGGLQEPDGLAFNSSGDLFAANFEGTTVTKITPGGVTSTFASGMNNPGGLTFDSSGNLYVAVYTDNDVLKITPDGTESTYIPSTGNLAHPTALLFQQVPEPSSLALGGLGVLALGTVRRKRQA